MMCYRAQSPQNAIAIAIAIAIDIEINININTNIDVYIQRHPASLAGHTSMHVCKQAGTAQAKQESWRPSPPNQRPNWTIK